MSNPLDELAKKYKPQPGVVHYGLQNWTPPEFEWVVDPRTGWGEYRPIEKKPDLDFNQPPCSHEWKEYIGLNGTETYKFCTLCDAKTKWNPFFKE